MPQATKRAQNDSDQWLAATEPFGSKDDARESIASVGSPDLVVSGRVSFNIFGFRILGGQLDD